VDLGHHEVVVDDEHVKHEDRQPQRPAP
jgi:hypothetical protein